MNDPHWRILAPTYSAASLTAMPVMEREVGSQCLPDCALDKQCCTPSSCSHHLCPLMEAVQHSPPSTALWTVQAAPDSSFGMRPLGQHGGQPGAVASGILIKMLMDLWLGNPPAISFPLALVLLHRCGTCEGQLLSVLCIPLLSCILGRLRGQGFFYRGHRYSLL